MDLHHLFKNSPSGIAYIDEQGRFMNINSLYSKMLGYSEQELKARKLIDFVHPEDVGKVKEIIHRISSHQILTFTEEKRYITKSGSVIWGQENISVLYDKKKKNYYAIEIVTDVTENKRMTKILEEALAELQDRNLELDQFIYRTSHDLRSPLTTILGLINLIKIEMAPEEIKQYINLVENRVLKLDNFLTLMLNYLKNTRLDINYELINFDNLLNDCLQELEFVKGYNTLSIKWEVQTESEFFCDPLRLKIIFQNIISNAIKYQNAGTENSYLNITITTTPQHAEVIFKDNGIGMKEEHLINITSMFFRASEKSDGSGLGMYIVKQAADRLKGNIFFESPNAHGMIIFLRLPNITSGNS